MSESNMHKLTLSMIVKNESHIIKECLESVSPYIDYWVIADNGSTDGTQQLVKDFFEDKGIPGELHEVEWVDFGHNRTEALNLCKGKADYCLMIDADDELRGKMELPRDMNAEGYALRIQRGDFTWWRTQIFKTDAGWKYTGVLHEYAECPREEGEPLITMERVKGDYFVDARTLGARNKNEDGTGIDPIQKYSRDAEVLLEALKKDPENARYQFYLAQSYFDSQQWEKSLEAYTQRAAMGGWAEEVFYSVFRCAMIKLIKGDDWPESQDTMMQAWNVRPHRAEPLYNLAKIHRTNGNPNLAYLFAAQAMRIPYPKDDILFISDDIYKWQILDEYASVAFYVNDLEGGYQAAQKLVNMCNKGEIPVENHERLTLNLNHYANALGERSKVMAEVNKAAIDNKKKYQAKINGMKNKRKKRDKKKARS